MLNQRTVITAKTESSYGVDATPVAGDAIEIMNPQFRANPELLERDILSLTLSKDPHVVGMIDVELSFEVEIKGSGAAGTAPQIGKLLEACAMKETVVASTSVTYKPLSDEAQHESLTIYYYKDGTRRKITGARGDFSMGGEAGKYGRMSFTFRGKWNSVTDTALVTPDPADKDIKPPVIQSAGLAWGGYAAVASQFNIAIQNVISRRESVNAAKGLYGFRIAGRQPVGSFNPDAVVEATHPFWSDLENGTERAFTVAIGATAGNILTVSLPKCVARQIEDQDDDGVSLYGVQFGIYKNSDAGDDEISLAWT